jgi:hypothetical protein
LWFHGYALVELIVRDDSFRAILAYPKPPTGSSSHAPPASAEGLSNLFMDTIIFRLCASLQVATDYGFCQGSASLFFTVFSPCRRRKAAFPGCQFWRLSSRQFSKEAGDSKVSPTGRQECLPHKAAQAARQRVLEVANKPVL